MRREFCIQSEKSELPVSPCRRCRSAWIALPVNGKLVSADLTLTCQQSLRDVCVVGAGDLARFLLTASR